MSSTQLLPSVLLLVVTTARTHDVDGWFVVRTERRRRSVVMETAVGIGVGVVGMDGILLLDHRFVAMVVHVVVMMRCAVAMVNYVVAKVRDAVVVVVNVVVVMVTDVV